MRRNIPSGAKVRKGHGLAGVVDGTTAAKVSDLAVPVGGHQDIGRFQITVYVCVCVWEQLVGSVHHAVI